MSWEMREYLVIYEEAVSPFKIYLLFLTVDVLFIWSTMDPSAKSLLEATYGKLFMLQFECHFFV
jgi:hypothetical protein